MIQGYFSTIGATRRPFVYASLQFPVLSDLHFGVEFLVDTGADRTMLSPSDAARIGIDLSTLSLGARSTGVGGQVQTREIETGPAGAFEQKVTVSPNKESLCGSVANNGLVG